MRSLLHHFWSQIIWCPTKCFSCLIYWMRAPSKIAKFDMPGVSIKNKNILWFYISVDNIPFLQMPQRWNQLLYYFPNSIFIKCFVSLFLQHLVQISIFCKFKDCTYLLWVVEICIHFDDIGVSLQTILYLKLLSQLGIKVILVQ